MEMRPLVQLAVISLLLPGCFAARAERAAGEGDLVVRRAAFASELVLSGELEAGRGEMLSVPPLPSSQTAIKWIIDDGSTVAAGETVVEFDNSALTADLESKRQSAMQAAQESQQRTAEWLADIEQLQLEVDKKKGELDKAMVKASVPLDIIALREFEERQNALRSTTVDYEKAVELLRARRTAIEAERRNLGLRMAKAQREIETVEHAIASLVLAAPREGIVVVREHWDGRKLQSGDNVFVGFPIALIPDFDSLRLKASLADVDDGRIAAGMPVTVTLDGYPDQLFRGRVTAISAVARESRRLSLRRHFDVLISFDALDRARMRPGLSARAVVHRAAQPDVLLAPRAAIDLSGETPRARLRNGKMKDVELGACNAQDCVVVSGLAEGDHLSAVVEVRRV
jgi:HlyD family secretion protein